LTGKRSLKMQRSICPKQHKNFYMKLKNTLPVMPMRWNRWIILKHL